MSGTIENVLPSWDAPTLQGFDLSNVQDGERIKGSNRQYIRFYKKKFTEVYATKVKINEKTGTTTILETGTRPVEREMVHIITPGDKNIVDDFACDFHRRSFWNQYKAFRDGKTAPVGMSLDDSGFVSPGVATELRYLGCHTVEQLADASDVLCQQIPNGFELREFARAKCKADLDNKNLSQVNILKAELEKSNAVIAEMQKQMQTLLSRQEPSEDGGPVTEVKRRGRPRKDQSVIINDETVTE